MGDWQEETAEHDSLSFLELPIQAGTSGIYENVTIEKQEDEIEPANLRQFIADLAPNVRLSLLFQSIFLIRPWLINPFIIWS